MALEVEGRKNRDTHRLFSTLESTLGDAVSGVEARSVSSIYYPSLGTSHNSREQQGQQ